MARIKIDVPGNILFSITIPIRISDINYGNHVGNDALVSILHEARVSWLKTGNYSEIKIEDAALIMSDLAIEYKAEAFHGDELRVAISIGETGRVNFDLFYTVTNQNNMLIAKAKTGMVCFNYLEKKVTAVPEKFKAFLQL